MGDLLQQKACLVLSTQIMCELAGAFLSKRAGNSSDLGRDLFRYFLDFIESGTTCLKMNVDLLKSEARMLCGEFDQFNAALSGEDYSHLRDEVRKLADGTFDPAASKFLHDRRELAQSTRTEVAEFVARRPALREQSAKFAFKDFLEHSHPVDRLRLLRGHLEKEFPTTQPEILTQAAVGLLVNPCFRVAHTMVKADVYITWRTARAGTLARDVQDDCYHLVNACYCDVYATKDEPLVQYAAQVIGPTSVRLYEGDVPISDWLLGLAAEPE